MIELTFLGITVLAPASEKAPWIPCRERDGYLAVSSSYFSQERRNLFKTSTLIMYLNLPFPLLFSLLPLYLFLSYTTPRTPLTLPCDLSIQTSNPSIKFRGASDPSGGRSLGAQPRGLRWDRCAKEPWAGTTPSVPST